MEENKIKDIRKEVFGTYEKKVFNKVPNKYVLMVRNVLDGDISIKGEGLRVAMPLITESRLVFKGEKSIDYPNFVFETKGGFEVTIDLAVTFKIVNPEKALYEHEDVFQELYLRLRNILTPLFKQLDYEEIARLDLNDVSKLGGIVPLKKEMDILKDKYGLEIVSLLKKSVDQDKETNEAFRKRILAEKEKEATMIKADAELYRIQKEADANLYKAKAEVEVEREKKNLEVEIWDKKIGNLITALSNKGMRPEEIGKLINSMIYTDGQANVTAFVGDNSLDKVLAQMGAAYNTGKQAVEGSKTKKK